MNKKSNLNHFIKKYTLEYFVIYCACTPLFFYAIPYNAFRSLLPKKTSDAHPHLLHALYLSINSRYNLRENLKEVIIDDTFLASFASGYEAISCYWSFFNTYSEMFPIEFQDLMTKTKCIKYPVNKNHKLKSALLSPTDEQIYICDCPSFNYYSSQHHRYLIQTNLKINKIIQQGRNL